VTFEEMEKSLIALRDNQVVQGEILNRVELALERNTEAIARNSETIAQNSEAIARNSDAIAKLADGFLLLQAAMKGLTETVDRFIRGLEPDGHHGRS
jgi:DNA anti-recombination protein RmuC